MKLSFSAILALTCFCFVESALWAQTNLNMVLQDSLRYNVGVNDVAGWVDDEGNEYALVGINTGVSIVNVDNTPINEVAFVPGVDNLWRDINTFGHYAYVTSEARVGLLIIDLQYLPDSVKTYVWKDTIPTPTGPKPFEKAHTLWIDEYGIAYLNGSNLNAGGVVLIDVASNPTDPVFLGLAPAIYSHDSYARDSILYSAEIYAGDVSIYDVHDPQNITLIGRVKTPNEFTHNAWLSDDSRYMFTTDERANSYVTSYDIQDPANIVELDRFRQASTDGSGNIPHNVYVWNDWLVIAYYTSGTLIVDAARPDNLIEVGSFDSYLGQDGGFNGVWGSYPFLPSGKILSSDRNSGLYVFIPNYVRAAYLEGTVLDSLSKLPLQGATVRILSDEIILPQTTNFDGEFKTGKAVPGVYDILVTKPGYFPKTIQATFINGELLTPTIELRPLPTYPLSGKVINSEGQEVAFAKVVVFGLEGMFVTQTDAGGNFLFPAVYGGSYEVQAGIWGETVEAFITLNEAQNVTLQLIKGYRDDFDLNLGWTVTGDAIEGVWARGVPKEQYLFDNWLCSSDTDSPFDQGDFAYSTGISASGDVANDEVSGGTTFLTSPSMDLDSIAVAHLSFDYWLCEFPPNQYIGFTVWLTNGQDTSLLGEYTNDTTTGSWQTEFFVIDQWEGPKDDVRIIFSASDTTSGLGDYWLKVHVDNFKLVDGSLSVGDDLENGKEIAFYPNPNNTSHLYFKSNDGIQREQLILTITDVQGRWVSTKRLSMYESINGFEHSLTEGMYFIQWSTEKGETGIEKIFVVNQ